MSVYYLNRWDTSGSIIKSLDDVRPYLGNGGYYTFAYFPPAGYNWQRIVVIGPMYLQSMRPLQESQVGSLPDGIRITSSVGDVEM